MAIDHNHIHDLFERLRESRARLRNNLKRRTISGFNTSYEVERDMKGAREDIAQAKQALRTLGETVDDYLDDSAIGPLASSRLPPRQPGATSVATSVSPKPSTPSASTEATIDSQKTASPQSQTSESPSLSRQTIGGIVVILGLVLAGLDWAVPGPTFQLTLTIFSSLFLLAGMALSATAAPHPRTGAPYDSDSQTILHRVFRQRTSVRDCRCGASP